MNDFSLLGSLAMKLHQEFVNIFYLLLPVFFMIALAIDWFRNPAGSSDFLLTFKRAFVATLLLVGFQEISQAILVISSGIADKIDNVNNLDNLIQMAGNKAKGYTLSPTSIVLGFNDLLIAVLTFLSYVVLYIARYLIVALYHFMWLFLSISAPLLLLFHLFRGTSQIPINLFKSMIEVASYKIVWAIMSSMMTALAFGNAYAADGNYLTVILLNFIIAIAMLGTPLIVKSVVGSGLNSAAESIGAGAVVAIAAAPARVATSVNFGRQVLNDTRGFAAFQGRRILGQRNPSDLQGLDLPKIETPRPKEPPRNPPPSLPKKS
ncbi:MAG: hypothetical protein HY843_08015 [Bdellovibrio sp.]|nr:hypothetical protein [Bdellovibrio sp.]